MEQINEKVNKLKEILKVVCIRKSKLLFFENDECEMLNDDCSELITDIELLLKELKSLDIQNLNTLNSKFNSIYFDFLDFDKFYQEFKIKYIS